MVATPASEEEAPAQPKGGVTAVVDTAEEAALPRGPKQEEEDSSGQTKPVPL